METLQFSLFVKCFAKHSLYNIVFWLLDQPHLDNLWLCYCCYHFKCCFRIHIFSGCTRRFLYTQLNLLFDFIIAIEYEWGNLKSNCVCKMTCKIQANLLCGKISNLHLESIEVYLLGVIKMCTIGSFTMNFTFCLKQTTPREYFIRKTEQK